MTSQKNTFSKTERLKSQKVIRQLFETGQTKVIYPYRIVWLETTILPHSKIQAGFSVPTRIVPKAVNRNRIKRQTKEIYRLHKPILYQSFLSTTTDKQLALMFIFLSRKKVSYALMQEKLLACLQYLCHIYQKNETV